MTWIQTASGRRFDLADPRPADVDFDVDIPDALSRIARFTGHIGGGAYSVGQHSSAAGDIVLAETGDPVAAAYAQLHDAKEAYIGDDSSPKKQAMAVISARLVDAWDPPAPPELRQRIIDHVAATYEAMEDGVDRAIHAAAGLPWPPPEHVKAIVKDVDLRLLQAERRQMLDARGAPRQRWWWDDAPPKPIILRLFIKVWPAVADEFRKRFRVLVSAARAALAAEAQAEQRQPRRRPKYIPPPLPRKMHP